MSDSSSKGAALITGASAGIGAVYADRLARRGLDLILVARNEARLKAVAARLREETGRSVGLLPANLSDKAQRAKIEAVLRDDPNVTMLVNEWLRFDSSRRALSQGFRNSMPAPRYRIAQIAGATGIAL